MSDPKSFKKAKIFWKDNSSSTWAFICPLCATQRKIPCQPQPTARHYAQMALTAAFFTLLTWYWFSWKGMVSFIPFWIIFEAIYRGRVRVAMRCPHCGFDPYLYLVDVKLARQEVESHWRKKFADKGVPYPEKPKDSGPLIPPSLGRLVASNVKKRDPYNRHLTQ
ncbi:hypothetical protein WDW37_01000 [Bdellovibrionota bacterium FG-1]